MREGIRYDVCLQCALKKKFVVGSNHAKTAECRLQGLWYTEWKDLIIVMSFGKRLECAHYLAGIFFRGDCSRYFEQWRGEAKMKQNATEETRHGFCNTVAANSLKVPQFRGTAHSAQSSHRYSLELELSHLMAQLTLIYLWPLLALLVKKTFLAVLLYLLTSISKKNY